jgi:hypothetical protein
MELLRTCLQDLRYAVRNLLRSRGFAAVAAITLTIGIGANTAIFSIIDTILLRPLPFRDPGQLVRLYETEAAPGHYPFAPPDLSTRLCGAPFGRIGAPWVRCFPTANTAPGNR